MKRMILTCSNCGSSNLTRDAIAVQSDTGGWEFLDVYDEDIWCQDCGAENSVNSEEIDIVDDETKRLTWKKLQDIISTMTDEQKQSDVTIYLNPEDEFFASSEVRFEDGGDVLDDGHPYLVVNTEA